MVGMRGENSNLEEVKRAELHSRLFGMVLGSVLGSWIDEMDRATFTAGQILLEAEATRESCPPWKQVWGTTDPRHHPGESC